MDKDFSGVVDKVFVQGNDGAMHHIDGGHCCGSDPGLMKHVEPTHVHQNRSDRNEKKGNVPLTSAKRNVLKTGSFALPGRRYPINDASHARNALARVSQHGSESEKARVRAAVHRKYPNIGKD